MNCVGQSKSSGHDAAGQCFRQKEWSPGVQSRKVNKRRIGHYA